MYLGLHYPSSLSVPAVLALEHAPLEALAFPERVGQLLIKLSAPNYGSALDVGCAVGGTSFELAKSFHQVDAFDCSEKFIATANRIQSGDEVLFQVRMEGDVVKEALVTSMVNIDRDKVRFFVGDACRLAESVVAEYDAVVLANLLCRLPDPQACLTGLARVVKQGAVALLVTPFTWLEEFTPRDKWIGGTDGKFGMKVLEERMIELGFTKIHEEDMPLAIREHHRKYQYIVSKATGWRKS